MIINKKWLIASSLLTLSPILLGIFLWDKLPDQVAVHFSSTGQADHFASRNFAIFGLPIFMLVLHIFALVITSKDPKSARIGSKMEKLLYFLVPVIAIVVQFSLIFNAVGIIRNTNLMAFLLLGIIFISIGNYLPKTKQNRTVGIRLPWTLANEDNWDKTHRLAGKLWVLGGLITLLLSFLGQWGLWLLLALFVVMVLIPIFYSYQLSKK